MCQPSMGDIRYIHSFVIGKDSCDLTFRLISTHIFEVRDAKVPLQKERFSIPPCFLPFSDSAEMEHWVKMVFRFLPRNIPTREQ